jgi:hypothetical protein
MLNSSEPRRGARRAGPTRAALAFAAALSTAGAWASRAAAQRPAEGFAVERFYPAAPGGGWFVMDDLDMRGGFGGAIALSGGYAYRPLRIATSDGSQHLAVVSGQAFVDVGLAFTVDRYRLYLNLNNPIAISGEDGTVGNYKFKAPSVDLGHTPDLLSDPRIGFDVRLLGSATSPFRLGAGIQVLVPNGNPSDNRPDYGTDGTFRGMARILFAGDVGHYTYAGQLGVHVRPLDDSPTPGSPRGSELLFGIAAGPRLPIGNASAVVVVGPELYGETAFASLLGSTTTGLEALLTGRLEGAGDDWAQLRVKLGTGGGISSHFGAPEWRILFGFEAFGYKTDLDKDGISDGNDACPRTPGIKTGDPRTSGCPVDHDGDGIPDAEDACPDTPGPKTVDPKTTGCPAPSEN